MQEKKITLTFDESSHTYTDEENKVYTSVTTLIDMYKKPFNNYYWSMFTALKDSGYKVRGEDKEKIIYVNGVPRSIESLYANPIFHFDTKVVKNTWKNIADTACERGNKTHNYLEDSINESKGDITGETNKNIEPTLGYNSEGVKGLIEYRTQHDLDVTDLGDVYPEIYATLLFYIKAGCIIYAEKRLYSYNYQIAGTIDVLIVKGKFFAILDWKTNKDKMYFYSGYYKKVNIEGKWIKTDEYLAKDKRLLSPISHLQDCKGILYSLQLSLYASLMIMWGYKLIEGGLMIYHLRPDMRPKLIKIDFKEAEIKLMLTHHYNTRILKQTNKIKFGFTN